MDVVEAVTRSRLLPTEIETLRDLVARRDPELSSALESLATEPLDPAARERIRRALVDELCELPIGAGRRALELEKLLSQLSP